MRHEGIVVRRIMRQWKPPAFRFYGGRNRTIYRGA